MVADVVRHSSGKVMPRRVVRAADTGELPCKRTPSGRRVFDVIDVDRWLASLPSQPEFAGVR
jgi:hypothetical protein